MKRNLKIAQLVPYYFPSIGGVEVVCQYISEELVKRGHEVHVFTANRNHKGSPPLNVAANEVINGVSVHRFRSYINIGHHGFFPGFILPLTRGRFDVIHAHGYRQPQSEISSWIGAQRNVPTVLHVHGGFRSKNRLKRLLYMLYDRAARSRKTNVFDHFIVLSEFYQRCLLELGVACDKISIIRNAADAQAFEKVCSMQFRKKYGLNGKKIVLYLGMLHHYKRPELLIQALPRILAKKPEAFLLLVGPDAGEFRRVRELGKRLGVTGHYRWIGPLHGTEKHEAIESCEFLALPSDNDTYPLVLLEAMARNKPVLTTSVVGQASIIRTNEAGVIVNPGDLDGIVDGAVRLLTDSVFRQTIGNNAGRLAEAMFNVKATVDEIETLYNSVILGRGLINAQP
jgi:glycosyltransferase involved in cell wall biosynthesis